MTSPTRTRLLTILSVVMALALGVALATVPAFAADGGDGGEDADQNAISIDGAAFYFDHTAADTAVTNAGGNATDANACDNMTLVIPVTKGDQKGAELSGKSYTFTLTDGTNSYTTAAQASLGSGSTHAFYFTIFKSSQWAQKTEFKDFFGKTYTLTMNEQGTNDEQGTDASEPVATTTVTVDSTPDISSFVYYANKTQNPVTDAEPSTYVMQLQDVVATDIFALRIQLSYTPEESSTSKIEEYWSVSEGDTASIFSLPAGEGENQVLNVNGGTYFAGLVALSVEGMETAKAYCASPTSGSAPKKADWVQTESADAETLGQYTFNIAEGTWPASVASNFASGSVQDKTLTAYAFTGNVPGDVPTKADGDTAAESLGIEAPTPPASMVFLGWTGTSPSFTASYVTPSFTLSADSTALFPKGSVTVTATLGTQSTTGEAIDPMAGTELSLSAPGLTVTPETATTNDKGVAVFTVSAPENAQAGAVKVTATASQIGINSPLTLTVATLPTKVSPLLSGTTSVTYDGGAKGGTASLKATPSKGYRFLGWSAPAGDLAHAEATWDKISPSQAQTYTANFQSLKEFSDETMVVYRLWNPVSGEHLLSSSVEECDWLIDHTDWLGEGAMFLAATQGPIPINRMYNPNNGDHIYSSSPTEQRGLEAVGWRNEGVCFYGVEESAYPVMRLYNPAMTANGGAGNHLWTVSAHEYTELPVISSWQQEGISWYAAGLPQGSLG